MSGGRRSIALTGPWVAIAAAYDDTTARNPSLHVDVRLLAAARSRMEFSGHAHFRRGELRTILSRLTESTGELVPLSPNYVTRRINWLVGATVLAAGSWSECLVLPPFGVQCGRRSATASPCPKRPVGRAENLAT